MNRFLRTVAMATGFCLGAAPLGASAETFAFSSRATGPVAVTPVSLSVLQEDQQVTFDYVLPFQLTSGVFQAFVNLAVPAFPERLFDSSFTQGEFERHVWRSERLYCGNQLRWSPCRHGLQYDEYVWQHGSCLVSGDCWLACGANRQLEPDSVSLQLVSAASARRKRFAAVGLFRGAGGQIFGIPGAPRNCDVRHICSLEDFRRDLFSDPFVRDQSALSRPEL